MSNRVKGEFTLKGTTHAERRVRMDLGLSLMQFHAVPGVCYTQEEIAEWMGVTDSAVEQIIRKALHKLRAENETALREAMAQLFEDQRPASRKRRAA